MGDEVSNGAARVLPVACRDSRRLLWAAAGSDDEEEELIAEQVRWEIQRSRWGPWARAGILSALSLGVLALAEVPRLRRGSAPGISPSAARGEITGLQEFKPFPCGLQVDNVDLWTRQDSIRVLDGIDSVEQCRDKCFSEAGCMAWTWGKLGQALSGKCYLKELEQGEIPRQDPKAEVISGALPCDMQSKRPAGTLFCLSLVRPNSYEVEMVAMQYKEKTSIFQCERAALYSNQVFWVAPGVKTHFVDTSLKCAMGGEFGTALNNDIFIAVWRQVVKDADFESFDWTVKADPDAVFFPARLREKLPHYEEEALRPGGVYINNCRFGFHGPLEVLSKSAIRAYGGNIEKCRSHFAEVCGGDCQWGEDMFIDQCFSQVVHVKRINDWDILAENHCVYDPTVPKDYWKSCDTGHVAFHPFKTPAEYNTCRAHALNSPDPQAGPGGHVTQKVWTPADLPNLECPDPTYDMDYTVSPSHVVATFEHIESAELCCAHCQGVPRCEAWVWKAVAGSHSCVILDVKPDGSEVVRSPGTVSGTAPFRPPSTPTDLKKGMHMDYNRNLEASASVGTFFCFSLVLPIEPDFAFMKMQHDLGTGIFSCDKAAVYSNVSHVIGAGVRTHVVDSDLQPETVGSLNSNTKMYFALWKKVIADQWYKIFDWTIKVDKETVFLAHRLPGLLVQHKGAAYLKPPQGLKGAVEVLSRNAVSALAHAFQTSAKSGEPGRCVTEMSPPQASEDAFLDQCFSKVLGLQAAVAEDLLCEAANADACPKWFWCNDATHIAFSPLGRPDLHKQCLANALFVSQHTNALVVT